MTISPGLRESKTRINVLDLWELINVQIVFCLSFFLCLFDKFSFVINLWTIWTSEMLLIIGRVWRHLSISRPPESASRALFFIASDIGTCSKHFFTFLHIFSPLLSCSRSSPCSKTQPGPSPADQWLSRERERGRGKKHFIDVVLNLLRSKDWLKDDGEGWHY